MCTNIAHLVGSFVRLVRLVRLVGTLGVCVCVRCWVSLFTFTLALFFRAAADVAAVASPNVKPPTECNSGRLVDSPLPSTWELLSVT